MSDNGDESLQAILCYVGGKHRLANRLIQLIPEHCTYVEPFCGGASVFFRKQLAGKNILCDIDPELINFYTMVRDTPKGDLLQGLDRLWIPDEKTYYKYRDELRACLNENHCLPNPDRGIIYGYVVEFSYGCKGSIGSWGFKKYCRDCDYPMIQDVINRLDAYRQKLKGSIIECDDYKITIPKYDSKCTFYYLDPPYFKTRKVHKWSIVDPQELADLLRGLKGKFLLSYDNPPELYDIFDGFHIQEIKRIGYDIRRRYDMNRGEARELLISNYPLPKV